MLFKDDTFPWKYFEQFLAFLDRFEVALPVDDQRILIPSLLPKERPMELQEQVTDSPLFYYRYIYFSSTDAPPGFWSRLLSSIMHSIPEIPFVLDRTLPSTLAVKPLHHNQTACSMPAPGKVSAHINSGPEKQLSHNSSSPVSGAETTAMGANEVRSPSTGTSGSTIGQDSDYLPSSLPDAMQHNTQLEYWQTGLYYHDTQSLLFHIEALAKQPGAKKGGIFIKSSRNKQGMKILGQLADLAMSLIYKWYPGLVDSTIVEQKVPCIECIKIDRPVPFQFGVNHCLVAVANNHTTVECKDDPTQNHTVSLADITPDLFLHDIDPSYLLDAEDMYYQEEESSLLGKGGYGNVYRGINQ